MSRIRQLVRTATSDVRNSSADEKASTENPKDLSNSGRDSRTDSSSSTTHTSGGAAIGASASEGASLWRCSDIRTRGTQILHLARNIHGRPGDSEHERRAGSIIGFRAQS